MITVILTGGGSRRMGRDKAALPMGDRIMALALADKYAPLGPVYFSVDRIDRFDAGGYGQLEDLYPGQGPINGIVSAFRNTDADMIFLTATDMPAGDMQAVRLLTERIGSHDACLYENEPLFALYRRSCLEPAVACMERGQRSLRGLLARVDALRLPAGNRDIFINLNTPSEYARFINRQENT